MNCYCSFKDLFCQPIEIPSHGTLESSADIFFDEETQSITCLDGYTPKGGATEATCTDNGDDTISWVPLSITDTTCGKRCVIRFSGSGVGSGPVT